MPISHDTTFAEYQRLHGVHFSALKAMAVSPKHYRLAVEQERADTSALALGRLVHALILTPEIAPEFAVWSGPKRGKAWTEANAQAVAEGKTIVRAEELERSYAMREAVFANPHARALLERGTPEVTVTWEEPLAVSLAAGAATEVDCRARLDWLGPLGLVEVKTTRRTLAPRSWGREVAAYAYHVQLAHYVAGLEANGVEAAHAHWIVVESAPPYDVAVYRLRREDLEAGERLRLTWLRRVAECEASGAWPGVGAEGPLECALPDYATTEGLPEVDMNELEENDGTTAE